VLFVLLVWGGTPIFVILHPPGAYSMGQNCDFFGLGTDVTAIYISNPAFLTAIIQSNNMVPFGTDTKRILIQVWIF
jgi:hypothetical protein